MQTYTLPGKLDSLKEIRDHVMAGAEAAGIEKKAAYRLALAVDEIATNVVTHGYEETGRDGNIHLQIDMDEQSFIVIVEDDGEPFDPRQHDDPAHLNATLEDRPIGGLGVFLAIRGVDQFEYEYADGKNRNIFIVKRSGG